jgi:integrase/recombinase XerD
MVPKISANLPITFVKATRAESDEALLKSWLRSLNSPHTQRNFEVTARRFLAELPEGGMRSAAVEDVRDALTGMSAGLSEASARQYVLRIKSLLGYAHALGYTPFNAGATIKLRSNAGNRGATLAKRIISEVEVSLLNRAAPSKHDRVLLEVIYAGGLRVSETGRPDLGRRAASRRSRAAIDPGQGRQGAPGAAARDCQPRPPLPSGRSRQQ